MIVEVDGKQVKTNFCMFDGNSFQVYGYWEEGDSAEKGKRVIDMHDKDIEKIIIVRKE